MPHAGLVDFVWGDTQVRTRTGREVTEQALDGRHGAKRIIGQADGEDIGAAVVYLASKEAGYVTGQTLHVNGGMFMS